MDQLLSTHMKFGAHVSIAGGIQNAPLNAAKIGCETFQMFTRSPQGGPAPKLTADVVAAFRKNCDDCKLTDWVIHSPYYINFASETERIRSSSVRVIREELERGSLIGANYVMFHPGSAKDVGRVAAMKHCIAGIKRVLDGYDGATKLLIEISAGAGMVIGDTFEELAELLDGVGHPELGICFDTAHAFASGYDLRDAKAVAATFKKFDDIVGLKRLKMSHCNDSKIELGGHKDRHEHLGKGYIGLEGFKAMVEYKKFVKGFNLYLETEPDGVEEDLRILKRLREE
jgi:deoxyribonuclease IV